MKTDTIAAIATAMTNSGIGIVRISGPESIQIIDKIFKPKNKKKRLSQVKSHTIHYGYICDDDKIIDEVLVLIMKAPNTYTAEETVEIDCHGGVLVMKSILETVIKYGASLAEPGEFTKRAFLNGRIDLTQAESVIDLINAKNDFSLETSVKQLQGSVLHVIKDVRKDLLYQIAYIESYLDDPEHVSMDGFEQKLQNIVGKVTGELSDILDRSENGELLKEGIQTVIVGKPNVGKSSLMNLLLGRERAIVTDIAGTTRDVIEEQINMNGVILNIVDTAGIRDTDDVIEKIGVDKAREYLSNSDLIIYVLDGSSQLDQEDENLFQSVRDKRSLILINKSDLPSKIKKDELANRTDSEIIEISAKDGTGVELIYDRIMKMFFSKMVTYNDEVYITNIRHKTALREALDSLNLVKEGIENQMPEDFLTIDLMNAYESLGHIIGESLEEDVVNKIFAEFCTGK